MNDYDELLARLDYIGFDSRWPAYNLVSAVIRELTALLDAERIASGEAMDALNEAGVPFEIHVEGGMCFTGLKPRIAWLVDCWQSERRTRERVETLLEELRKAMPKKKLVPDFMSPPCSYWNGKDEPQPCCEDWFDCRLPCIPRAEYWKERAEFTIADSECEDEHCRAERLAGNPDPHKQDFATIATQCICGQPGNLWTVHRADGPCFQYTSIDLAAHERTEDLKRVVNLAARFAACLWDYHSTCPECGNNMPGHMPGCAQVYESEFRDYQDTERVFALAFLKSRPDGLLA